jgi:cytoskeletal protein CcmA (bactofilin family)
MGSLSNLYISQSYQSLIHLGTDNTASATLIQLQDGLGNNLGVGLNTQGDISASGDLNANTLRIELDTEITGGVDINTYYTASTPAYENQTDPFYTDVVRVIGSYPANPDYPTINDVRVGWICNGINVTNGVVTAVSGSGTGDVWITIGGQFPQISQDYTFTGQFQQPVRITGSLEVSNAITASNIQVTGDMFVSGTIHAYEVITLIESSSVIFSSGSNVIGDDVSDTQTIVGQTTISGSLTIDGPLVHRGNVDITGSLKVSNDISSSTVSGIGNVQLYSASVDSRLDYIEGPFSTSVDQRLDSLEFFSSSQEAKDLTLATYTGSVDTKFNAVGVYTSSMNQYTQSTDARISNIENYTSSLRTAFTASGTDVTFNGNINVSGSITAYEIHTIIESSSVIFSSGSNVLGDNVSDTQTLNGTVNIPNTLFVAGVEFIPFSSSVDLRLDQLEQFSSSLSFNFVTQNELAAATGSLINSIATKLDSSSFQTYTSSLDTKWNTLGTTTASLQSFTSSQESKDSTLATYTGSIDTKFSTLATYTGSIDAQLVTLGAYTGSIDTKFSTLGSQSGSWITEAETGSFARKDIANTFTANNVFSGSVRGNVTNIVVTAQTASMDCSLGNFFTLSLPTGSVTRLEPTNIQSGETISLRILQGNPTGSLVVANTIKFSQNFAYSATPITGSTDIITFISFDNTTLYGVSVNNLI